MSLLSTAKHVRRDLRSMGRLVRMERATYPGALHPSMWRRGFLSSRAYSYPDIDDPSVPYISDVRYHFRSQSLNSPSGQLLLAHKNVFAELLLARGLGNRAPEVYGTITADGLKARSKETLERLREQPAVIVKPTTGRSGQGVRLLSAAEAEGMVAGAGPELLVQERMLQHPDLARIYPGALNTARVLAVRVPQHGVVLAGAIHRWGRSGTGAVDNVSSGGLSSGIDLETGRLGRAIGKVVARRTVEHARHPDTGAPIAGVQLPEWSAVRELTLALMDAFPELEHVGWDLAVGDGMVQVIEGNATMPDVSLLQFSGPFAGDPRLRGYYTSKGLLPRT